MRTLRALACVLVAFGSSVTAGEAVPEGWEEAKDPPDWVVAAPPREGFFRFVDAQQSNLLHLAYPFHDQETLFRVARREVRVEVARRLRPLLGAEADVVAEKVPEKPAYVRKAFHLTPPERGRENVVGGQTYTAWVLWEVPAEPLLAAVPEARREEAKKALERAEVPSEPAWETVDAKPAWVDAPPAVEGHLPFVSTAGADRASVAKVNAWWMPHLSHTMRTRLHGVLDAEGLKRMTHVALVARVARKRAMQEPGGGKDIRTWTLWDVPIAALLDAVPEDRRDAVRKALAAAPEGR